ncbi:hypothetical protein WJX72_012224 [[Myrmecia] bisecta]|uniref:Uncharacterized protein n=1 Tax=[Myrmecia] bisecta TaxID=41462 RepID=A0AAW1PUF9_9CHLO
MSQDSKRASALALRVVIEEEKAMGPMLDNFSPLSRYKISKVPVAERRFAFEAACRCVEDAQQGHNSYSCHAAYFQADRYKVLRKALSMRDERVLEPAAPAVSSSSEESGSGTALTADSAATTTDADLQLADTASSQLDTKRRVPWWKSIKALRRPSATAATSEALAAQPASYAMCTPQKACPADSDTAADHTPEERTYNFMTVSVERAFDALLMAAPTKGEVEHWVWLLRAFSDRCSIDNLPARLAYLAKVVHLVAAEEAWMRLLVAELAPVLDQLRTEDLLRSTQQALHAVADRGMQVGEQALCSYRTNAALPEGNAAVLAQAVKLLGLLSSCGVSDCSDQAALFEEHLSSAASARYKVLVAKLRQPAGPDATQTDVTAREMSGLTAVCRQLAQDMLDDEQHYQPAFPPACRITLPAISCRVYCHRLKPDLERLLALQPPVNEAFFELFHAVHQIELKALKWCAGALGKTRAFADEQGAPLFLPAIKGWMKGVEAKMLQWGTRLLAQEMWEAQGTGVKCSRSLVDFYGALLSVVEEHCQVAASHHAYALLLERALCKVVQGHVASLEQICQSELPKDPSRFPPLRALGLPRTNSSDARLRTSPRLCLLLNDMREIRSKQADLAAAVRGSLPDGWWGAQSGWKTQLGDRFKLSQVEIERRYAAVLHRVVKRVTTSLAASLATLMAEPANTDDASAAASLAARLDPIIAHLQAHLDHVKPCLDYRVYRRIARELWNATAGHLHDILLTDQESRENSQYNSLDAIAPRIKLADATLKQLTAFFTYSTSAGLKQSDEPEKVKKLRKMLDLFMREDMSESMESLSSV